MNADILLEHFHRLGDAPDAVPRLRRFVLALAVQGKVVARNAAWQTQKIEDCLEPLSDGRLMHQGWSPQCATHPSPNEKVWGVLKTTSIQDGYFLDEQNKELPEQLQPKPLLEVHVGDILLTCAGPRARCGVACLVRKTRKKLMISGKMYRFRPKEGMLSTEFLALFLRSEVAQSAINAMKTGSSESGLNLTHERFRTLAVSFPPLPEQHRIVAKVDELMALCDRLEAAQQEREQWRTRLTAASWQALTSASDPNAALFALEQLPALTTRPQQIAALRQTILDLAVRGRLVKQDEKDEPAEVLLKRIAKEKERLVKEGKVKKEKAREGSDDEEPTALPKGWVLVRMEELTELITKGSSPKWQGVAYVSKEDGVLFITSENVGNYRLRKLDDLKYVERKFNEIEPRSILRHGDILVNLVGASIGRAAVYDLHDKANINQAVALIRFIRCEEQISTDFLLHYLNSTIAIDHMLASRVVTAQPNMSLTDVRDFPVPLPPLAEQRRIVAKVDELMRLCDALEAALVRGAEVKGRLLEAVLHTEVVPRTQPPAPVPLRVATGAPKPQRAYVDAEVQLAMAAEPVAGLVKRGPGRPRKAAAAGENDTAEAILGYLQAHAGWHGKAAILEATGVEASEWNAAIKELLEAGKVERQGEKKGARYRGIR